MNKKKSSIKRRIFSIVVILVIIIVVVGGFIGNYFYNLALNPKTDKSMILDADQNKSGSLPQQDAWFKKVGHEGMFLESRDKLKLHGIIIKQKKQSHKYAIVAHGYTGSAERMIAYAPPFYDEGYNVLLPDARGHGQSEGGYIGMGWDERLDIIDWADSIIKDDAKAEIVLYGLSMGSATVMNVTGEELPTNIKAVVADCGYTSVFDVFAYQLKGLFNLPAFPFLDFANIVTKIRAGYSLKEAAPINQVKKAKVPIFLIQGDSDTFVPSYMEKELYDAIPGTKQMKVVKGAGHGESAPIQGKKYWADVFSFYNKYL